MTTIPGVLDYQTLHRESFDEEDLILRRLFSYKGYTGWKKGYVYSPPEPLGQLQSEV